MRSAVLLALFLAGGCAHERVILLPDDHSGEVGKIMVWHQGEQALLDSAFGSAEMRGRSVKTAALSEDEVHARYHAQLAGLPPRPISYTLYFLGDSDDLTVDSRAQAPAILAEIAARPAAEVVVTGHTDRLGETAYNDELSRARARAIRDQLIALGFEPVRLSFRGRGEREPLVPTADEIGEPRNRRVEIMVR